MTAEWVSITISGSPEELRAIQTEDDMGAELNDWEVEIKIRRKGRLVRREAALGVDALMAFENASNDLVRDLETELSDLS